MASGIVPRTCRRRLYVSVRPGAGGTRRRLIGAAPGSGRSLQGLLWNGYSAPYLPAINLPFADAHERTGQIDRRFRRSWVIALRAPWGGAARALAGPSSAAMAWTGSALNLPRFALSVGRASVGSHLSLTGDPADDSI